MPIVSRTFIDYACYHIVTRGNQKQIVFKGGEDYRRYLSTLRKAKRKHSVALYAYCLMPTHVHLLIEPASARDMSKFMHWLSRGYTSYFNNKYEKVGHLWQGRYKSKPIIKGQYLIHCAHYIETNPLRKNMITDISEYLWSSYKERCLSTNTDAILDEIKIEVTADAGTGSILT